MNSTSYISLTATHRLPFDPVPRVMAVKLDDAAQAQLWLNHLARGDEYRRDGNKLLFNNGMVIESMNLEEVMAHACGVTAPRVELQDRYFDQNNLFRSGRWHERTSEEREREALRSADAPTKREAKPRRPERPSGYVTVADVIAGSDLTAPEARAILRTTETKPPYGWAWAPKDVARIRKLLGIK